MKLEEKIKKYLGEAKVVQLDAIKVVKVGKEYEIKFKGLGRTISKEDLIQFKDTDNVRKKGFEPGAGGDIIKVNKNGTVTVEANTDKREDVRKTVTLDDIYLEIEK